MKVKGIERVALQVKDLDAAAALFSKLLGTTFQRHQLKLADGSELKLAFSALGIELLQEGQELEEDHLRSFHLRVADLAETRAQVAAAGGTVLAEFSVGQMAHLVTRIGAFRIIFVAYPGDDSLKALAGEV